MSFFGSVFIPYCCLHGRRWSVKAASSPDRRSKFVPVRSGSARLGVPGSPVRSSSSRGAGPESES